MTTDHSAIFNITTKMKFTALPIPFGVWSVESKDKGVIELKKNYGYYADSLGAVLDSHQYF